MTPSANGRSPIRGDSRFLIVPDAVAQRIGTDTVLVHMGTNRIYELNETGARLWQLLAAGHPWSRVMRELQAEFDVEEERLVRESEGFVAALLDHGLLSSRDG